MTTDDHDLDQSGVHFSARESKTEMKMTMIGARVLLVAFGLSGIGLAMASGNQLDQQPTIRTLAATLVVLAGQMVIAIVPLRGHLTLLRAIEQLKHDATGHADHVVGGLRDELHVIAEAARRDDLRTRRNHN